MKTDFKSNSMDPRFKKWTDLGISSYCKLIEHNTLQSFQQHTLTLAATTLK